jgi:hypothetical protein
VLRNLGNFIIACPGTPIDFITTVTRANVAKVEELVAAGLDMGVHSFIFREVFYYPDNDIVDHSRMPGLVLREGEFRLMMERVLAQFDGAANFLFADNQVLHSSAKRTISDSKFVGRALSEIYSSSD